MLEPTYAARPSRLITCRSVNAWCSTLLSYYELGFGNCCSSFLHRVWMQHCTTKKWYKTAIVIEIRHGGLAYEVRDSLGTTYVRSGCFLCLDAWPVTDHSSAQVKLCSPSPSLGNLSEFEYASPKKNYMVTPVHTVIYDVPADVISVPHKHNHVSVWALIPGLEGEHARREDPHPEQPLDGWDGYRPLGFLGDSDYIHYFGTPAGLFLLWRCVKNCNRGSDNKHACRKNVRVQANTSNFQTSRNKPFNANPSSRRGSRSNQRAYSRIRTYLRAKGI